jgi:hypothetical protein
LMASATLRLSAVSAVWRLPLRLVLLLLLLLLVPPSLLVSFLLLPLRLLMMPLTPLPSVLDAEHSNGNFVRNPRKPQARGRGINRGSTRSEAILMLVRVALRCRGEERGAVGNTCFVERHVTARRACGPVFETRQSKRQNFKPKS